MARILDQKYHLFFCFRNLLLNVYDMYAILVGGFKHFLFSIIIYGIILPID